MSHDPPSYSGVLPRTGGERPMPGASWWAAALFGLSFWGLATLSRYLSVSDSSYVPLWLPCGLYFAVLLVCESGSWPRLMVAALGGNAAFDLSHGTPFVTLLGFYVSNTVQVLAGVCLLRRFAPRRLALRDVREFVCLVAFGAGAAPAVGGVAGAATLVASEFSPSFVASWLTWFANGAMANLLVVPLVLVWANRGRAGGAFGSPARLGEFGLLVGCVACVAWWLLVVADGIMSPNKSLLLPFLLWAALRFGLHGVTLLNFVLAIFVAFLTTRYLKGLTPEQVAGGSYVGVLQLFLAVSVLVALVPTIVIAERDRRTSQLDGSRQRTQLATEATGVGIWELDLATDELQWDAQMFRLYGMEPTADGRVPGDVWRACSAPDELLTQETAIRDALQNRGQNRREFRIRRPSDGAVRVIQAVDTVRRDAAGRAVSVVGANLDITERKAAEDALRASEERFRRLVENGNEVVSLYDATGTILYESPGVERVKGFTAAELVGTSAVALVHPDDLARAADSLARVLTAPGAVNRLEIRCRHKDGSYRWLEIVATNLLHEPSIRAIVGNYRDVTALRTAIEELRASSELLRKLSEQVPGMIYQFRRWADGRTCFPYASAGIRNVLGLEPEDLRESGARAFERVHPDDLKQIADTTTLSTETLSDWRCEFRVLLSGRGERWLLGHARPERQPDGSTLWHGNLSDITEHKRLEERLLRAQKMEAIGQLAGGVAHDFNNLLTVINGAAGGLHDDLAADDPRRVLAAAILDAGERAAAVTAQLLAFSRKTIVAPKVFDLNEVVARSERLLRRLIGEDVALTVAAAARPCVVNADPTQIDQVVMNLAVNARDAMPTGGKLHIETRCVRTRATGDADGPPPGRYVQLSISDTGVGMTDEVRAKVFEPFFTTKELGKGTGLGLATVYGIVKQANGFVEVESAAGRGTTFRVLLPEAASAPAEARRVVLAPSRGAETVLLAEDDDAVRAIATTVLEAHGYTVVARCNGREALGALGQMLSAVDILVTDVVMPEMSGRELANAARALRPDLRVLYVSGYTDDAVVRHGVTVGDAFLQKPFTPLALAQKVRAILDGEV